MIRVKQQWGIIILALVSIVYLIVYLIVFLINNYEKSEEVIEIHFAERIHSPHITLIDRFNKLHKGKIKVVPINFPNIDFSTNERKELLARFLRGGSDNIDLFAVDVIWVKRFAKWCEPLDEYFTTEEKATFIDPALRSCYSDGNLVAVPLDMVYSIMYYREDLINQLPDSDEVIKKLKNNITWEEFVELGKNIKSDNPFYIFPGADYEGMICSFMDLILSIDRNYFEKYGFDFNRPEAEKSLRLLVDLVNKHELTPSKVADFTEVPSYKHFIEQNGLFLRGWHTYDKDFEESPYDPLKESQLKRVPIPYFKDHNPGAVFGGWDLMVSKFSKNKEAVIKFLKFLVSCESQELFYEYGGYFPIRKELYEDSVYAKKYPELIKGREMFNHGLNRPSHENYTRYSEIMSHYFHQAINNKIEVKEALKLATTAIKNNQIVIK
ncbi:MAG: extracellular solute-binding protein [Melioribacteraceae bacterium]|nr:extracellular solute-binding protein [Melioribacteraceae bacterium]